MTFRDLVNDLDHSELIKTSAVLLFLKGWTSPEAAAAMVREGYAVRSDLVVRSPTGKSVRIKVIALTTEVRSFIKEGWDATREEGDDGSSDDFASPLPRSMKKWVVSQDFVERHSEEEFARLFRRVKTAW